MVSLKLNSTFFLSLLLCIAPSWLSFKINTSGPPSLKDWFKSESKESSSLETFFVSLKWVCKLLSFSQTYFLFLADDGRDEDGRNDDVRDDEGLEDDGLEDDGLEDDGRDDFSFLFSDIIESLLTTQVILK